MQDRAGRIAMRQALDRKPTTERGLALPIAAALALKLAALTIIYLMFFVPTPSSVSAADRAAASILGLR
jgi:hypothetical protein